MTPVFLPTPSAAHPSLIVPRPSNLDTHAYPPPATQFSPALVICNLYPNAEPLHEQSHDLEVPRSVSTGPLDRQRCSLTQWWERGDVPDTPAAAETAARLGSSYRMYYHGVETCERVSVGVVEVDEAG